MLRIDKLQLTNKKSTKQKQGHNSKNNSRNNSRNNSKNIEHSISKIIKKNNYGLHKKCKSKDLSMYADKKLQHSRMSHKRKEEVKNNKKLVSARQRQRQTVTPILTPIISENNPNINHNLLQMEQINNRTPKQTKLQANNQNHMKKTKKKQPKISQNIDFDIHEEMKDALNRQMENSKYIIQQNAKKSHSLQKSHRDEINKLEQELNGVTNRLKNQIQLRKTLQKQIGLYKQQLQTSKLLLQQKDKQISLMNKQKISVKQQISQTKQANTYYKNRVDELQGNIIQHQQIRKELEDKLKKAQQQKIYIKKNTQEVLRMLRNDFGIAFGKCTNNAKQTKSYLQSLDRNY